MIFNHKAKILIGVTLVAGWIIFFITGFGGLFNTIPIQSSATAIFFCLLTIIFFGSLIPKTQEEQKEIDPKEPQRAIATAESGGIILVKKCPYCGQQHSHSGNQKNNLEYRMADCFKGNYWLDFSSN